MRETEGKGDRTETEVRRYPSRSTRAGTRKPKPSGIQRTLIDLNNTQQITNQRFSDLKHGGKEQFQERVYRNSSSTETTCSSRMSIVLYLYIYIALLAVHTNQKRFQCERPREKRAVVRERKKALGYSPVNKVDRVQEQTRT